MRVLLAHNHYKHRGGEDAVFEDERTLLTDRGVHVASYECSNDEFEDVGPMTAAINTLWNSATAQQFEAMLLREQPDVIHVHNTFAWMSPAVYWVAARHRVPVVQTLHNFRLLCPQATFLRDGQVCEACITQIFPISGVRHGCYHNSRRQTLGVATMLFVHRSLRTWHNKVSRFIALNEFCRAKFVEGGLPEEAIRIKPNFVAAPQSSGLNARNGGLFVGRLSPEKGLEVLVAAIARLACNPMLIIGSGPLELLVKSTFGSSYLGPMPPSDVMAAMASANYLVVPSIWYENFPRTIVEAFASGLPVIASRLGALKEIVDDGRTGLLFEPGNPNDLAQKISWAEENPDQMRIMGRAARKDYETMYSPDINFEILMGIYTEAIEAGSRSSTGGTGERR
jgi:glycosyltransferase involved in cell wall biosynthesis